MKKTRAIFLASIVCTFSLFLSSCLSANGQTIDVIDTNGNLTQVAVGGASALNDLTDVNVAGATTNQALIFNGSIWVNGTVSSNGTGTSDHATLSNLDFAHAGHTGFQPSIVFNGDNTTYLDGSGNFTSPPSGGVTNPLTTDLNFAFYKAIAMSCDNGATLPATPAVGTWFLHTPTGRKVLEIYDGTAWNPIMSFGTFTVYVDGTDGTDSPSYGTGVDADAFKTVQYAVNCIPGLVGGNVVVNIAAGTYAESVSIYGKSFTGSYSITLNGTLTAGDNLVASGAGVKGATSTQASWTDTGLTTNAYQHKLFNFTSGSNNGLYRVVDSNSTTVVTLCGRTLTAQPALNDTATVYDWGTIVTSVSVAKTQQSVYIYDLSASSIAFSGPTQGAVYRCCTTGTGTNISGSHGAYLSPVADCVFLGASSVSGYHTDGWVLFYGCKFVNFTAVGCFGEAGSKVYLQGGNVIDGITAGTKRLYEFNGQCIGNCWAPDVYNFLKNGNFGTRALGGSEVVNTAYNNYSGCGTSESAEAVSYSYID